MFTSIFDTINNTSFFWERVVSLFIFLIVLLFFTILIKKGKSYKQIKLYLISYLICLAIMGFMFIPSNAHDLYRLYIDMHKFDGLSWISFMQKVFTSIRYTRDFLYFVVVKLGNDRFLAMFASIIYYSIVFYIIYDYSKTNKVSSRAISKTLFLYMIAGQFGDVVAGIRSFCAFALCALCIYRELYKNKSLISDIIFYILAIGMHSVSIPIILVRMIFLIFQKESKIYKKIINVIIFLIILIIGLKYGDIIIQEAFNKGSNYINTGESVSWLFWNKIGSWIILSIILFIIYNLKKKKQINKNTVQNYKKITIFFIIFELIFAFIEDNIFYRFSTLTFTLFLPFVIDYYNMLPTHKYKHTILYNDLILYALMLLLIIIEFSRGTICGIKFFIFN